MKAHDVRQLVICETCNDLGDRRNMIELDGRYRHGKCYADLKGVDELLRLPKEQLHKLTLGDIGPDIARCILEQR